MLRDLHTRHQSSLKMADCACSYKHLDSQRSLYMPLLNLIFLLFEAGEAGLILDACMINCFWLIGRSLVRFAKKTILKCRFRYQRKHPESTLHLKPDISGYNLMFW